MVFTILLGTLCVQRRRNQSAAVIIFLNKKQLHYNTYNTCGIVVLSSPVDILLYFSVFNAAVIILKHDRFEYRHMNYTIYNFISLNTLNVLYT